MCAFYNRGDVLHQTTLGAEGRKDKVLIDNMLFWCYSRDALGPFAMVDDLRNLLKVAPDPAHPEVLKLAAVIEERELQVIIQQMSA